MSKTKKNNRSIYLIILLIVIVGLAVYFLRKSGGETELETQSEDRKSTRLNSSHL